MVRLAVRGGPAALPWCAVAVEIDVEDTASVRPQPRGAVHDVSEALALHARGAEAERRGPRGEALARPRAASEQGDDEREREGDRAGPHGDAS